MKPTVYEARYEVALDHLAEETGRKPSELHDEITEEAEEVRNHE